MFSGPYLTGGYQTASAGLVLIFRATVVVITGMLRGFRSSGGLRLGL